MSTPNIRIGAYAKQRRSQRILLSIAVVVSGRRTNGATFSERTRTVVVNAHGGLISLSERVSIGQQLQIKNVLTNEEISCTVADLNPGNEGASEIGVEFPEPCPHFWRVAFPPVDWSPHSEEAKRFVSEIRSAFPSPVKK